MRYAFSKKLGVAPSRAMSYFALGLTPFFPQHDRARQYLSALYFEHDLDINEVSQ